MTKVFYHNDADGLCSAFWVRKHLESTNEPFTPDDFIEMNYDREFPIDKISQSETVYIVDFSIDQDKMWDLRCITKNIIWIDHHKSAIDNIDLEALDLKNCGLQIDGIAACMLTYLYFNRTNDIGHYIANKLDIPTLLIDAPIFTQYIHLWDTWKWKDNPSASSIEAFITGFNSYVDGPCDPTFDFFITDPSTVDRVTKVGHAMIMFRDSYAASICKEFGKMIQFEGYHCFVCNLPNANAEWFKSIDTSTYDILMPFKYNMNTKKYIFSLYTNNPDIDVSKIARKYGGNGHRQAAGFTIDNLPWIVNRTENINNKSATTRLSETNPVII